VFVDGSSHVAGFETAWFGASPPAGLQVGSYTGTGVGLGAGGDQVNVFDGSNTLVAKVILGATPAGRTIANVQAASIGSTTASNASQVGVNGAALSNNGLETGSPGVSLDSINLSRYARVNRYDLPEPTRTAAPPNSLLAQEASAVTYDWD